METKLWSALIGLSKTVDSNPKTEHTDSIIMDCLQHLKNHTVTQDLIDLVHKEKDKISPGCKTCTHPCGNTSDYDMSLINDKNQTFGKDTIDTCEWYLRKDFYIPS